MKKFTLLFFSFCLIIVMTSCKKEPAPLVLDFSAKFVAQCNGVEVRGNAVINKNNIISLTITQPASMEGYTYYFKDDSLTLKYDKMIVNTENDYLPETSLPSLVYNVFKSLHKKNNCYLSNENELYAEYSGSCEVGKFVIVAEYSMGTINEIKINNIDFSIKFSAIKIIN